MHSLNIVRFTDRAPSENFSTDRTADLGVFKGMTREEIINVVSNICIISPQRGCIQCCRGCHAGAATTVARATWADTLKALRGIKTAMELYGAKIKAPFIEIFRDSDPGHIRFPDRPDHGVGNFAKAIFEHTGKKVKLMTSGAFDDFLQGQLVIAGPYFSSASVSLSIQTKAFKTNYLQNVRTLTRTIDTLLTHTGMRTPVYADVMMYSADGNDPNTERTFLLLRDVFKSSKRFPSKLVRLFFESRHDGTKNDKFCLPGLEQVAIRTSPFLGLTTKGRGKIDGQSLDKVSISDTMGITGGSDYDMIRVGGNEFFLRRAIKENLEVRNRLITILKKNLECPEDLKETVSGLDRLFRTEFDLAPVSTVQEVGGKTTRTSGINFIVSNPVANEIQDVISWKRLFSERVGKSVRIKTPG